MAYGRFFAMIATSTVVMLGLMYLNTYLVDHVFFSETRTYMALLMGAVMSIIMLSFMLSMYKNRTMNIAIYAASILVFALTLWLVRSQATVQDRSYMSAMIPHHSIAIMTSSRAEITDARVRKLADEIIYAQDKEIAEMRYLIADIAANGEVTPSAGAEEPQIVSAQEALSTEVRDTVDPGFITEDDVARLLPGNPACRFFYTETSPSVFVTGEAEDGPAALLKISGDLVRLNAPSEIASGGTFETDGLTVEISPAGDDLHDLRVKAEGYEAGFRGLYTCA